MRRNRCKRVVLPLVGMLVLLCVGALSPPHTVAADSTVAVLITGNLPRYRVAHDAFLQILETGGYGQDKARIFVQTPNSDRMSLANAARRAVAAGADILIVYGAPAADVARREVKGVPVVFADIHDPVGLGLIRTLAAPGTDMTGASSTVPLEPLVVHLMKVKPLKRVGVLFTAAEGGSAMQAAELEVLGGKHGFTVQRQEIAASERVSAAIAEISDRVDALYFTESVPLALRAAEGVEQARQRGVPVISQIPQLGEKGALLNLEADPEEQGRLMGVHVLQILAGQKAHILPVRTPRRVSLTINRGVAQQLNLHIPDTILAAADRVID
jgi:putative tryptophan/tyrosine transport system substrate-binding protein